MQLTEQHDAIRATVSRFVREELNPHVDEWEAEQTMPCHEILKKVAIVDISMTQADVVVIETSIVNSINYLIDIGGVLSLYAGFSFLSLAEVFFWVFQLCFSCMKRAKID